MREEPDPEFAVLLKELREQRRITQEQLAFDAGITASALSRIERGLTSPGWPTVRRIARALGLTIVELARAVEGFAPAGEAER